MASKTSTELLDGDRAKTTVLVGGVMANNNEIYDGNFGDKGCFVRRKSLDEIRRIADAALKVRPATVMSEIFMNYLGYSPYARVDKSLGMFVEQLGKAGELGMFSKSWIEELRRSYMSAWSEEEVLLDLVMYQLPLCYSFI